MSDTAANVSGNRRLSSRLQKRAPASIKITPAKDWNVAIPLLSPLYGSPPSLPIRTAELKPKKEDSRSSNNNNNNNWKLNESEKAPTAAVHNKWQHPAAPFCYSESSAMRPFMFCTTVSDRS